MKKLLVVVLAATLAVGCECTCGVKAQEPVRISLFAGTVNKIARQRKLALPETAKLLAQAGVTGFDAQDIDPKIPEYLAAGLKFSNCYGFMKFLTPDYGAKQADAFLAVAVKYGAPCIMIVPDNLTDGGDQEAEFAKILVGVRRLAVKAKAAGIAATVEDFGGNKNPCSYAKYLKRFLDEIPELGYALDSGNLYYAGRGECILDMTNYAKRRIRHVHLKDQTREDNHKYATLGLGAVPNEKVVKGVMAMGYAGWFTLENLVGDDTYADVVRQASVLKAWLGR